MSKAKEDMKMKVDFDGLRKQATQNANALHRAIDELGLELIGGSR